MPKIRVGVLRGGPSSEYEISLQTGENVLKYLPKEKYETHDVLLTKDGLWHFEGFPKPPEKIFPKVDVIFNALHGEYGEDGEVQKILGAHRVFYTGSGVLSSKLAMKKWASREIFRKAGIRVPHGILISKNDKLEDKSREAWETVPSPWIIKPAARGSSVGVSVAGNLSEIWAGLKKAFHYDDKAMVEERISGQEATAAVLENFRGEKHYALPVVEILPPEGRFFDYEVKYNGATKEICPGRFSPEISEEIKKTALAAHALLGCRHYSRSDFIVSPGRGIFMLEINTLPGLTSESLLPKAASAVGLEFPALLDHLVSLALSKK